MKKISLKVEGMHCKSCEIIIGDALEELDGVQNVEVSNESGKVSVEFDESRTNIKMIKDVIVKEGYKVV